MLVCFEPFDENGTTTQADFFSDNLIPQFEPHFVNP